MPENDSSKVTPNEQDPYSLPVLSEIAGRALLPESEKEFYAAWEAEAEIFGTIKVFFAHGEDPAALIRLLADSEDYVAEVTIRVRDRETAEGKRKALDLAGFRCGRVRVLSTVRRVFGGGMKLSRRMAFMRASWGWFPNSRRKTPSRSI